MLPAMERAAGAPLGAADLVVVNGDRGAAVWTVEDLFGEVSSSAGTVGIVSLGNVRANVTAFEDAFILSEGDLTATIDTRLGGHFGQVMRALKGQGNPQVIRQALAEALARRRAEAAPGG